MRKISFFTGLFVSLGLLWFIYFSTIKNLDSPESHLPTGLIILYNDGSPVMLSRCFWKDLSQVPPSIINALLSSEDKNFTRHIGIDLAGIARATVRNISQMSISEGGSTITQQLARTLYLSPERSWTRKIKEMFIALWIERVRTKDEILQMYLNSVYMGNGLYGFASASKYYFDKDLSELSLEEGAILIGTVRSPENFNPKDNPDLSKKKARTVLKAMVNENYLRNDQYEMLATKIDKMDFPKISEQNFDEEIFWRIVRELNSIGFGLNELRQGYKIYTTLDPLLSRLINDIDEKNVSLEAINPSTGTILAYKGVGVTYPEGRRLIGSSVKPLYYYLALLEGWGPESKLSDLPIKIGDWTPENFDKKYKGSVTLADALIESRNVPSVNLFMQLGKDKVIEFLKKELMLNGYYPNDITVSLGTIESAPEELLKCYAAIFNGGAVLKPYVVKAIEDPFGRIVYRALPQVLNVVKPRENDPIVASGLLLDIMKQVVNIGTGVYARQKVPVAGKTGTSDRNAWFIGGDSHIILSVVVDGENITGGTRAAPLWAKIMSSYPYRGVFPGWKTQTSDKIKNTRAVPTIDAERIIQWLSEGKLSEETLMEMIKTMSDEMVLDILSALNQFSPELARELWEKIKDTRSW